MSAAACPSCGAKHDALYSPGVVSAGDLTICVSCMAVLMFTQVEPYLEGTRVIFLIATRLVTTAEIEALHPSVLRQLHDMIASLSAMRRQPACN